MAIAAVNSATGELIRAFEAHTAAEIEGKLQKSFDTFVKYRNMPFAQRAR
jgi:succinate-semialdehyde dehydrogenase / glutarate-semialdehyde dehydrogenase